MLIEPIIPKIPEPFAEDVNKFLGWIKEAKPGDWYVYHTGKGFENQPANIEYIKKVVWSYACAGRVYLFRNRLIKDSELFVFKLQKASKVIRKLNPVFTAEERRGK